ncbi:hypothetical protein HYALB_00005164 [Hymenoscyphus albidus]|uniref:Homeobox domain-containing protein n=1 Tax=Hymenoscyphus albidus TaxID=595503 RepID=A0A9N9LWQ8_9HELO|nr:hypothetical protein HYALB_00005164 [Hymenoscyphus albidus]
MTGPFKPPQEKALKESYARDCNPTIGETILLVHATGLEKLQVTRWFGRRRSEARGRGEELKTVNAEKNGRTAHSMIDLVDDGEIGKGGGEDGGKERRKEKDDGGDFGKKGVKEEEDEEKLEDPLKECGVVASVEDSPDQ